MKHTVLQYVKFIILVLCFLLAYLLYQGGAFHTLIEALNGHGYISVFLAGLLFSSAFTTPFAIGMFVELAPDVSPLFAAPVGGLGAMLVDLSIFEYARFSFHEEFHHFWNLHWIRRIGWHFHHHWFLKNIRIYLLWSVAGLIIASPFPDELGVTLLSSVTDVRTRLFALFCFGFNTIGIFLILMGARAIG
ncbi:hypothetical protein HYZ98_02270 [Candidatus Peregrinibacteria bacterium]|nr:hypothetical protein [Candidatus Peregrinibacteria bacterium]